MKRYAVATITLVTVLMALSVIPLSSAAGSITLTPPMQDPGLSVIVDGTGFGSEKTVGIGLGAEVTVEAEEHIIEGDDLITDPVYDEDLDLELYGPFGATANHVPIKPGSVTLIHYEVDGVVTDLYDLDPPNGTMGSESPYAFNPFCNYANGSFGRQSTADFSGFTDVRVYITYTYYTHNVTPAGGVTSNADGTFSAEITVPAEADGDMTLTVVDSAGNIATANMTVIPEGLTVGVMLMLSTIAVVISARYFRKHPKTERHSSIKL